MTQDELMLDMWRRGLGYDDVMRYSARFNIIPPTRIVYCEFCAEKNEQMEQEIGSTRTEGVAG